MLHDDYHPDFWSHSPEVPLSTNLRKYEPYLENPRSPDLLEEIKKKSISVYLSSTIDMFKCIRAYVHCVKCLERIFSQTPFRLTVTLLDREPLDLL